MWIFVCPHPGCWNAGMCHQVRCGFLRLDLLLSPIKWMEFLITVSTRMKLCNTHHSLYTSWPCSSWSSLSNSLLVSLMKEIIISSNEDHSTCGHRSSPSQCWKCLTELRRWWWPSTQSHKHLSLGSQQPYQNQMPCCVDRARRISGSYIGQSVSSGFSERFWLKK